MARFSGTGGGSGAPGPQGPEGESAYDIAVANGFIGTEQEWLDSLGGTDSHGNFYFDESTLKLSSSDDMVFEKNEGDGRVAAQIKIGAGDIPLDLVAYEEDTNNFGTGDWSTASWEVSGEGGVVLLTGCPNVESFLNTFNGEFQKVIINDAYMYPYTGSSYGGGSATIYILSGPEGGNPVEITSLTFAQSLKSGMTVDYDEGELRIKTSTGDIVLDSTDDIDISADDDIRFYSNDDGSSYNWRMTSEGVFELPGGGYINNPSNSSGDGYGNSTIKIVPNQGLEWNDQYIIIDPTQPNHIHIRAGGQQDNSKAELIIGSENTNMRVVDSNRTVYITSQNQDTTEIHSNTSETSGSTMFIGTAIQYMVYVIVDGVKHYVDGRTAGNYYQPYLESGTTEIVVPSVVFQPGWSYEFGVQIGGQNSWQFQSDGFLSGPAEGSVKVYGIYNDSDYTLPIVADNAIVLRSNGAGEFLNDETIPNNQIATIGDISNATPVETSFTVNGGSLGTMPTFNGAPLFSGSYVKTGPLVHFQIQVDMDNILTFGSGQYYVDLPFDAKYGYDFRDGCLHDISSSRQYAISGHVFAGTNRLFLSYTDSNGQDATFDYNSPVLLDVADNFHISGTYIAV